MWTIESLEGLPIAVFTSRVKAEMFLADMKRPQGWKIGFIEKDPKPNDD